MGAESGEAWLARRIERLIQQYNQDRISAPESHRKYAVGVKACPEVHERLRLHLMTCTVATTERVAPGYTTGDGRDLATVALQHDELRWGVNDVINVMWFGQSVNLYMPPEGLSAEEGEIYQTLRRDGSKQEDAAALAQVCKAHS